MLRSAHGVPERTQRLYPDCAAEAIAVLWLLFKIIRPFYVDLATLRFTLFQTSSSGLSSGEYGGKKNNCSLPFNVCTNFLLSMNGAQVAIQNKKDLMSILCMSRFRKSQNMLRLSCRYGSWIVSCPLLWLRQHIHWKSGSCGRYNRVFPRVPRSAAVIIRSIRLHPQNRSRLCPLCSCSDFR